ncbi:SDR family oxidoreductase [Solibacillus daqui]|uniref:SDR family oxidoreductase n=1 Tax=Solibacillus daqui TaxID=2912187 RepID=UPI0023659357|nr:SDR family oxidoreductase [Solibacillus daqui]
MGSHFVTGFPGFVATHLINELFKQKVTSEVIAIVQSDELACAKVVAKEIEQHFEQCQIILFEGDITLPNLDLADADVQLIAPKISIIWHLAAEHNLMIKREKAWKVNVHGTANVNDFTGKLPNLKRYMYFSTAFIAGKRQGEILEMELIRPPAFHNFIEESKFEAELLVDDLKLELPVTIIRPTMIYGHSQTGRTQRFDGIYFLMNMIGYLKNQMLFPQVGSKNTDFQVVALDYVVNASIALCLNNQAEGETVHLTDINPYKVIDVYQKLVQLMTKRKTFSTLPLGIAKVMLEQSSIRTAWHVPPQMIDYLDHAACFDTKDCERLLEHANMEWVDLLEVLPNLVDFYENNKHLTTYQVKI